MITTDPTQLPAATSMPTDNSDAPTTPSQDAQPQPQAQTPSSSPATAPANILPPSITSGVHGVLAGVALGALAGAAHQLAKKSTEARAASGVGKVASKVGQGLRNFAMNTPEGQQIQKTRLEQQEGQQRMQLAQQEAADRHTAAVDADMEAKVRTNGISLDNAHKVKENEHLETLYPMQEEAERNILMKQHEEQNTADRDMFSTLESIGVHIDTSHGAGHAGLTANHAQAIASGKQTMLSNGETGDDAGYGFVSNAELQNTPLSADVKVATDWNLDPKTGAITPVYSTLTAGQNTAMDALIAHDAGMKKFNQLQGQYKSTLDDQSKQAGIAKDRAEAGKDNAEAAKARQDASLTAALNPKGSENLGGADYLKTLPPAISGPVQAIAEGRMEMSPRLLATKQGQAYAAALTRAYPDWDQSKGQTWFKARNEFMGSGKTAVSVNSFNTALEHMQALYDHSTTAGIYEYGSKDYQDRKNDLTFVSNEVGKAIKNGIVSEAEGEQITKNLNSGLTPGQKRENIAEASRLLHDKIENYQTQLSNAAPSSSVNVPNLMNPKSASAYDYIQNGGKTQQTPPTATQVGSVITQNGQQFRVTSVDANGKVTGATPAGAQ
jgi:hypothetical protein